MACTNIKLFLFVVQINSRITYSHISHILVSPEWREYKTHWIQFLFGSTSYNFFCLSQLGRAVLKVLITSWIGIKYSFSNAATFHSYFRVTRNNLRDGAKITFMLNLARWTGPTAISNNFVGFWKNAFLPKSIPLLFQLRKISRTYDVLYACYKCFSGVTEDEELVHSSPPQISAQILPTIVKNEQDIVALYVCELAQQSLWF